MTPLCPTYAPWNIARLFWSTKLHHGGERRVASSSALSLAVRIRALTSRRGVSSMPKAMRNSTDSVETCHIRKSV